MTDASLGTRARESLLAGALGDAWGHPYEGRPGPLEAPFPAAPTLSDDTWLTMATCEAIVRDLGRVVPTTIAASFREWFQQRRLTGVGSSTLKSLRDLAAGAHWALAGARGEFAAGSGAAMRAAPLGFALDPMAQENRTAIRDVSRITHHSDEAYMGALAVAIAVRMCSLSTGVPSDLLAAVEEQLPDSRVRDRLTALRTFDGGVQAAAQRFGNSGYVVDAIPLALLIAAGADDAPLSMVLGRAVSLGGDTDTIAAIAGQVLGAAGYTASPELLATIPKIGEVEAIVGQFAALMNANGGPG
jgi:ADP-ribosyl-[dinitrogen reductase] hydrolase